MILTKAERRAQEIQKRYEIPDGKVFLLRQALAEFDRLVAASRVESGIPDEALRHYCEVAVDRAWTEHPAV